MLLLGEQMGVNSLLKTVNNPTASRLRFEPRPFCASVQHANHSATESPPVTEVHAENTQKTRTAEDLPFLPVIFSRHRS